MRAAASRPFRAVSLLTSVSVFAASVVAPTGAYADKPTGAQLAAIPNGASGAGCGNSNMINIINANPGPDTTVQGTPVTNPDTQQGEGPPSLSVTEVTSNQVLEEVRKRREDAAVEVAALSEDTAIVSDAAASNASQGAQSAASGGVQAKPVKPKVKRSESGESRQTYADPSGNGIYGVWAQGFADYEERDETAPGDPNSTDSEQRTYGFVAGLDKTINLSSTYNPTLLTVGVFAGASDTKTEFGDTASSRGAYETQDGGFVGVYAAYNRGAFSADLVFKTDFFEHRERRIEIDRVTQVTTTPQAVQATETFQYQCVDPDGLFPSTGTPINETRFQADVGAPQPTDPDVERGPTEEQERLVDAKVDQTNYNIAGSLHYRFPLHGNAYLQPTGGFLYTYTDYGSGATALSLDDGELLRLQGGLRLGTSWISEQCLFEASIAGLAYSDVYIDGFVIGSSALSSVSPSDEGKVRALGLFETSVRNQTGQSFNLQAQVRGGEDLFGVGGRVGFRHEW